MKKIMVFGRPGSGKTHFAERLGEILKIPVFHLDKYFYLANWQEKPEQDFLKDLYEILKEDAWILDGNCMHSLPLRLKHADTIIYFKMNRILCLYRI
jgi:adenylate kinase family enzyme